MLNLIPWKKRDNRRHFSQEGESIFSPELWERKFYEENPFLAGDVYPKVEVSEGKKEISVKAELPGIDKNDLKVFVDGKILTIKGEKKQEKEEKDENYHRVELTYGSFKRVIELPAEVDGSGVDAYYKRGVLKVVLKKAKESGSRRIAVRTG